MAFVRALRCSCLCPPGWNRAWIRSEKHPSELTALIPLSYYVFRRVLHVRSHFSPTGRASGRAVGRLLGTVLSGGVFQRHGLAACLMVSAGLVAIAALASITLPRHGRDTAETG